ncbi:MAG: TetR/AcrR family transcriptional regulator [Deltaproteobacteria bacterium]|jgi:AcrR family transcriptional regulator|nr:TetR/AcrR family transcriptional regulator [Deltaproteobacteria bacterium]
MKAARAVKKEVPELSGVSTKEHIRQVALKLFAEFGYENVSIRKICACAGIAVGTFYNHYGYKQEILLEIYTQIDDALRRIPESLLLPFKEEVLAYVKTKAGVVQRFHETYDFPPVFLALQKSESKSLMLERRDIYYYVVNSIMKGQYKGEVRKDLAPELIAKKILRFLMGVIFDWTLRDCVINLVDLVDAELGWYLDCFVVAPSGTVVKAEG